MAPLPPLVRKKKKNLENCSHILTSYGERHQFDDVIQRIKGAKLPVLTNYRKPCVVLGANTAAMEFFYDGRCTENDRYDLERIINGLISLYKS